jgi:hypothetical protein
VGEVIHIDDKLRATGCRVQAWRDVLVGLAAVVACADVIRPPSCDCAMCRALAGDPSVVVLVLQDDGSRETTMAALLAGEVRPGSDGRFYLMDKRALDEATAAPRTQGYEAPLPLPLGLGVRALGWFGGVS